MRLKNIEIAISGIAQHYPRKWLNINKSNVAGKRKFGNTAP